MGFFLVIFFGRASEKDEI